MNNADILRLRILLGFLQAEAEGRAVSVTGLSRTLAEEKYSISRALGSLEEEGLVDRKNPRHPFLTETGKLKAKYYAERVDIAQNHLLYEGVDAVSAEKDSSLWALYNTDVSMDAMKMAAELYSVKYRLREKKEFSGAELCRYFKDGVYEFPFVICRKQIKEGKTISMANEGFENPCALRVKKGIGTIRLRARNILIRSPKSGKKLEGKVSSLSYFENGEYIRAEHTGSLLGIPMAAIHFVKCGEGVSGVFYGTVLLKFKSSVGESVMPEAEAVFALMI